MRENLKGTEKELEEVKAKLDQTQKTLEEKQKTNDTLRVSHSQELKNRQEAYSVVQERNKELEKKLSGAQTENSQLSEWIGKLESVSGDGQGFAQLRKELEGAWGT